MTQPTPDPIRVLLVEDNPTDTELTRALLAGAPAPGFELTATPRLGGALTLLPERRFDLVLLDLSLPDARDLDGLHLVRAEAPGLPIVVLTGREDEVIALQAVRGGAQDYLVKSRLGPEVLLRSIRYALERHRLRARLEQSLLRRDEAESELKQREEYFRALIENSSNVITVTEADGTIRYESPSVERMLGYTPETLIGSSAFELIHPQDLPQVMTAYQELLQSPFETRSIEWRARHSDGSWRIVQSTGSNLLGTRAVSGIVINSRDVTERRNAEAATRASDERTRLILESSHDAFVAIDEEGRVLEWNAQAEETLGWSRGEALGRTMAELIIPEEERENHRRGMEHFLGTGDSRILNRRVEVEALHRDGHRFHVELSTTPIRVGESWIFTSFLHDISERKQAEREREENLSLLRTTLESTADGILAVDADGRFSTYNQRFAEMWRISDTILQGNGDRSALIDFVVDKVTDPEHFLTRMKDIYANPNDESLDLIPLADGRIFERYTKPQHDAAGKPAGRVLSFRDLTDRLELQAQFHQAQKMEAIGQLAGGVAHDFNNLLMVIKGTVAVLLMDLPEEGPLRDDLAQIDRAADGAAQLTRQLLAFSRMQVLEPRVVSLNELVQGVEKMLRRVIGEHIRIETRLDPAAGLVKADPGQLEQVIMNLAVNARDAMSGGGTLTIRTEEVHCDLSADGAGEGPLTDCVRLSVSDTGTGMDEATRARIFDPFFTTKEREKGTGLGLSTVSGIVEQSGGSIQVRSTPGEGSSFVISLPRCPQEAEVEDLREAPAAVPVAGAGTVLLVEDDEPVRRLARRALERGGYDVLEAAGGEQALSVANDFDRPLDLLLTDVVMPGLGGRALAERLAPLRPEMKVAYMSGYPIGAIDSQGSLDPGMVLLQKPFGPDELMARVGALLGG
ncbi:MAG: PAS domain S-box protein [Longimicrobiaceae bacterium]